MCSGDSEVECPVCQTQILLDKVDMDSAVDRACYTKPRLILLPSFRLQSFNALY